MDVGKGLDVVNDGGLAEKALNGGEGRTCAHFRALAFKAGEQGGFFPADVGSSAFDGLQHEVETGAENVLAEQSRGVQVGDGFIDESDRIWILGTNVENAMFGTGEPAGDHHPKQHAVGLFLHQVFVDVGSWIAFIGIADDVFHRAFSGSATGPFEEQREACTTATAQAAFLEFDAEGIAITASDEFFEWGVIRVDSGEGRSELCRLEMGDDSVAVFAVATAGLEEITEGVLVLTRVVFALILQGCAFMAAAEAADVADLVLVKMLLQGVMKILLSAGAKTGAAIADEDFFTFVFFLQEIVEAHSTERDSIAKKMIGTHAMNGLMGLRGACFVGGIDHAFEDIFFDTFAEGESAEIFRHWKGSQVDGKGLFNVLTDAYLVKREQNRCS